MTDLQTLIDRNRRFTDQYEGSAISITSDQTAEANTMNNTRHQDPPADVQRPSRIREFDPDQALEKALALFWRNGYAETTMRDVVAYTGVAHAGLYSAFGSKRALFKTALVHHRNTTMAWLLRDLESPDSGRAEVEQFFETVLHIIKTGDFENGCFMLNTGIAFGGKADDIMATVHKASDFPYNM